MRRQPCIVRFIVGPDAFEWEKARERVGRHRRPFSAQTCVVQGTRTERLFRTIRAFRLDHSTLVFPELFSTTFLNTPSSSTVILRGSAFRPFRPFDRFAYSMFPVAINGFFKKNKYYLASIVVTFRGPSIQGSFGRPSRRTFGFFGNTAVAQTERKTCSRGGDFINGGNFCNT